MTATQTLQPAKAPGQLTGFGNLFARESRKWWRTRRWWMQALIWLIFLNGFVVFGLFVMPTLIEQSAAQVETTGESGADMVTAEELRSEIPFSLFGLASLLLPVGVIILVQSQVYAEKRSGVAAWVLSKPVSRAAYLLAKLTADAVGILVVMLIVPMTLAYLLLASAIPLNTGDFLLALGLLALLLLFYQVFTLMMSVIGGSSEVVMGAALGLLLGGMVLKDALARLIGDLVFVTPWMLPDAIGLTLADIPLPPQMTVTLIAVPALTLLCLGVMFWQFRRQEL